MNTIELRDGVLSAKVSPLFPEPLYFFTDKTFAANDHTVNEIPEALSIHALALEAPCLLCLHDTVGDGCLPLFGRYVSYRDSVPDIFVAVEKLQLVYFSR